MYTNADAQSIAAALIDGGWTSKDTEEIQREYGFSAEELEQVIECMRRFEPRYEVICESDDGDVRTELFEDYDDAREYFHSLCARADTRKVRIDRVGKVDDVVYDREEVA